MKRTAKEWGLIFNTSRTWENLSILFIYLKPVAIL